MRHYTRPAMLPLQLSTDEIEKKPKRISSLLAVKVLMRFLASLKSY
jgi:hypothetical protein